jgi:hypothetical protein
MEATAAALKKLFGEHVDGAEHLVPQYRRAGLIPAGDPGYGGCRRAHLSLQDAALLLLACFPVAPTR